MFTCNLCNKNFKTQDGLNGHKKVHSLKYPELKISSTKRLVDLAKDKSTQFALEYFKNPKLCLQCNKTIPIEKRLSNYKIKFCSKSCNTTYNNLHNKKPSKRSQLEKYTQKQLQEDFPNLEIYFNDKSIGTELDIFIPEFRLAIEINGIVHYQPIYGLNTLDRIQQNDIKKMEKCSKHNIKLLIIDVSGHSRINTKTCIQYYSYIKNIISEVIKH